MFPDPVKEIWGHVCFVRRGRNGSASPKCPQISYSQITSKKSGDTSALCVVAEMVQLARSVPRFLVPRSRERNLGHVCFVRRGRNGSASPKCPQISCSQIA